MFFVRYIVTFAREFWLGLPARHRIQGPGETSFQRLMGWCHANASYCAEWRVPLYYCWDRRGFSDWMNDQF